MARTIILGYDGSECAKEALDAAVDSAQCSPGSRIVVVNGHAVHKMWGGGSASDGMFGHADSRQAREGGSSTSPDSTELESLKRHAQANIQPLLDEASARITAAGVPVEVTLEWDTPVAALLDVAEKQKADLIVVGTHGADSIGHAIGRVILGSTPTRLVHLSRIPVLVVPKPD